MDQHRPGGTPGAGHDTDRWVTGTDLDWPAPVGVVVVPTDQPWRPGDGDPRLRLGQDPSGTLVGLAYSSPAALAEAWGERQPWIAVDTDELTGALRPVGVELVLVDGLPAGSRSAEAGE